MKWPRFVVPIALSISGPADAAAPCPEPSGCTIDGGRYLAVVPEGWDGSMRLPVLVFFHGWRESAESVAADPVLREFATRRRILLIAPHGEGNTWSFPGSPGRHRDEFAFVAALAADVRRRFPVDEARFAAAGFSQGASMVWNIACRMPEAFATYGALAGGFWEPAPEACSGKGVNLIHLHGRNDPTVPLAGRALRGGAFRQGNVLRDWRIWTAEAACEATEPASVPVGSRLCKVWMACADRKALAFCIHEGEHQIHAEDIEAVWSFVEQRAGAR